jgi:hypothetical protein
VVSERLLDALKGYLAPVPTPEGFTSREIVRRAIEFDNPPRVPYSFVEPPQSDFVELAIVISSTGELNMYQVPKGELVFDKWGVGWRSSGRLWGHADVCPLADLSALDSYQFPEPIGSERLEAARAIARAGDEAGKYVVGADPINSFERLRSLMGFAEMMVAMYAERERFERLLDKLTEMTVGVVQAYAETRNVHSFMTWDDWGLQTGMQIRPAQWRELFKPRYARIVEECHRGGMHYILHSCGFIWDIIPDLIEIGVDVLQLDQPRLMGIDRLADEFGRKICFWNAVDIQWSPSEDADEEEIRAEVQHMAEAFGRFGGGFIARQYPQPRDIGMSPERHDLIYQAFMDSGCR